MKSDEVLDLEDEIISFATLMGMDWYAAYDLARLNQNVRQRQAILADLKVRYRRRFKRQAEDHAKGGRG